MDDAERTTRPATIGELRQRLRSLGEPWTVPARFNDDDPLPDLPSQHVDPGHIEGLRAVNTREEFEARLRDVVLVNSFLAARWRELGAPVPGNAADIPDGAGTSAPGQEAPKWGVG